MEKPDPTQIVYRDGHLLHIPGPNPGTPYTRCGLDAGLLIREERSIYFAGIWCTSCLQKAAGMIP